MADLSDYSPESLAEIPGDKIAIFVLATYGEGDPSDNASPFWDWVTKEQSKALSGLRYMAFGLGNSNYRYYNRVVEVVDGALQSCGASRLLGVGMADDANGTTEEDFASWKEDLVKFVREELHMEEHEIKYEPTLSVIEDDSLQPADLHLSEPVDSGDSSKTNAANSPIKPLTIANARELYAFPDRSCMHLDFDLAGNTQISYKTGDHLAIWPMNPDQEVERLLSVLGLSDKQHVPIGIKSMDPALKIKVPTPTTFGALVRHFLEICAPVSRDVVCSLAEFAPSPASKDFLLRLGRDKDAYAQFLTITHVNIGRLLELALQGDKDSMDWSGIPLSFLIESLPRTQPRYYSISSSSVVSPRSPAITVGVKDAVLTGETPSTIPGLATNYLQTTVQSLPNYVSSQSANGLTYTPLDAAETLQNGTVYAHIRRSKFKLPALGSCPLIMVAAGTGLAPFRAFINERLRLQSVGKPVGPMILFFGCQRPEQDYIYQSEIEELQTQLGDKLRVVTAFSRVEGGSAGYVQDKVAERSADVCDALFDGASFYICGRASMAREVGKVVRDAVGAAKGWDESEVKDWSERMKRNRKWQEDVWG